MPAAFEINKLRKSYGTRVVLNIERAEFPVGEITAIVGPNGCGKTTLLECLNGLQKPDAGEILFMGQPLSRNARRRMTLVLQASYLFSGTVGYNVAYGLRARGRNDAAAAASALAAVRLEGFGRRRARSLSGGEAQRTAIARALAISPEALLLDEPTANIDAENTSIIEDIVRTLCDTRGITVILATHSREQAVRLAHRVLLLHEGRLVPFHPDNHFRAVLADISGEKVLLIGDTLRAVVATDRPPGPVFCNIPPEDIIISAAPFASGARNCWSGMVTAIILESGRVRITVDTGIPIVAVIPIVAYEALRPEIGAQLYLTFKASAIRVF